MLLKSLQLSARSLRGISRVISVEIRSNERLQNYSRWAPRRPAAIVNEDELFDVNVENTTPPVDRQLAKKKAKSITSKVNKIEKPKVKTKQEPFFEPEEIEAEYSEDASLEEEKKPKPKHKQKNQITQTKSNETKSVYTKLRDNEKIVSSMLLNLKTKKKKKKDEQILLEGIRFIKDAMEVGMVPEAIIFSRYEDIKDLRFNEKITKLYKIPYRSIQLWSTLSTPPGTMGIFKKPEPKKVSKASLPITIICDNVRDPGNMGSILRACAGVGCEQVILTKGCVDFWNTKVLRSAAGAHFRIPIFGSQEWDDIRSRINQNAHVYIADNNIDCNPITEELIQHSEVVEEIENEDVDVDEKYVDVDLPKKEALDFRKRRLYDSFLKLNEIPVIPYYSADYTKNEVILIVGGETWGLSKESFTLVENHQGVRVNIPLTNGIESLNAGMALGIVAFEVKRQFLLVENKLNKLVSNKNVNC